MQDVTPKDRPKLYVLIAAVVVVLIYAGKTTYDGIVAVSPGATPPAPPAGAPAVAGVAPVTPGATASPVPTGTYVLDGRLNATGGRDPFTPVSDAILAAASVRVKSLVPIPTPSATPGTVPKLPLVGGLATDLRKGLEALDRRNKALEEINMIDKAPPIPPPVVKVSESTPVTLNDGALARRINAAFARDMGAGAVKPWEQVTMGADDFAYYVAPEHKIPGFFWGVGGTPQADLDAEAAGGPRVAGHHSGLFKVDAKASVVTGATAMTTAVLELLARK